MTYATKGDNIIADGERIGGDMTLIGTTNKDRNIKIKEAMVGAGHSQADLARLLGLNRMSVSRKLNEESEWKVSELEKLAEIYGKSKLYFF